MDVSPDAAETRHHDLLDTGTVPPPGYVTSVSSTTGDAGRPGDRSTVRNNPRSRIPCDDEALPWSRLRETPVCLRLR